MIPVLLVDDDAPFCRAFGRALAARGCRAVIAANLEETRKRVAEQPDLALAIVDLNLDGASGLEVIGALRVLRPRLPGIVLSARFPTAGVLLDEELGAVKYVSKSSDLSWLAGALERGNPTEDNEGPTAAKSLDLNEWEHIHRVLKACGGNKSEAARRLGICRSSLQRKLTRPRPRR